MILSKGFAFLLYKPPGSYIKKKNKNRLNQKFQDSFSNSVHKRTTTETLDFVLLDLSKFVILRFFWGN